MTSLISKHIKNRTIPVAACMLMSMAAAAQTVSSGSLITLPTSGSSLTIPAGQVANYKSAIGIEMNPEVTIEQGAEVTFEVGSVTVNGPGNWRLTRAFGLNNAVGAEVRSFYDDRGVMLQYQKRDMVSGNVLASQIIYDYLGRPVLTTLMAPTLKNTLEYQSDFVQNAAGTPYTAANFDLAKMNTPDALGNTNPGTLGWYYSNNNSQEPYVGATGYPYTMTDYYNDGSNEIRKSGGIGEQLKMGSGHEARTFNSRVVNELDHYLAVRNKFFATTQMGELPGALGYPATISYNKNKNGQETVVISDGSGHVLMSAQPGTGLTVNNYYGFDSPNYFFRIFTPTVIDYGGTYQFTVYDMNTEQPVSLSPNGTLPAGYYKMVKGAFTGSNNMGLAPYIRYATSFSKINYSFYNQHGQLVAFIPVEGVNKLLGTGINNYANKSDIPYISTREYNQAGLLSAVTDKESGRIEFTYRKDGNIRFSQNAQQRASGKYSYINYDKVARNIESGEFTPSAGGISFSPTGMSNLESTATDGGLGAGTKSDWTRRTYDVAVATGVAGYTQDDYTLARGISYSENSSGSKTWYNYNDQETVVWMVQYIPGLGYKTIDYTYDEMGNLTKRVFQKNTPAETFAQFFDYDQNLRLKAVYAATSDNAAAKTLQAKYIYYLHGPLKRVELGSNVQGIDFSYTAAGSLKAINNANRDQDPGKDGITGTNAGFAKDAFGMNIDYYNQDYSRNNSNIGNIPVDNGLAPDQFGGNIKSLNWHSRKPASVIAVLGAGIENPSMYAYSYDNQSQLTSATWGTPVFGASPSFTASTAFAEKVPGYDNNGNITSLQRTDGTGNSGDNLIYSYIPNTNQVQSISNNGASYRNYTYDVLGRLTSESVNGGPTRYIKYNIAGRVLGVYGDAAFTQPKVTFTYNEQGQRIAKNDAINNTTTYYVNDGSGNNIATYIQSATGAPALAELPLLAGSRFGLFRKASGIYEYELTDHLGNVRAVIDGNKTIKQYGDYYPFGSIARNGGSSDYRYGYQGQNSEADPETGWQSFSLRMYDSKTGRWLSPDPKRQYASPYLGMGNNPVNGVDKDGGAFWNFWEKANVRQAREFAQRTNSTFDKWKGQDKKTWASAQAWVPELEGQFAVVFAPGSNHYDWLRAVGVPVYTAELMTKSGFQYVRELAVIGDAWARGSGEYYRDGQAPDIMKALLGANPLFGIPNNITGMHISADHTDFMGNKYEKTSDYVWGWIGVASGIGSSTATELIGYGAKGLGYASQAAKLAAVSDKLLKYDITVTIGLGLKDAFYPSIQEYIDRPPATPSPIYQPGN
ncbi:RHS repeat domain-containing protein [Chitinophaga flava]|uniref:RHS repeat-associated core domain-containing protein n=1 Tax=Chitinophaga flava TaxID=2259036 RepID=A0A365Y607_9BACT|nr:RHS repeat-associated core domain-containing protein [Chitinophaga flava]RBL93325.1 hypothetical protein DF182_12425 [Chitinophaga flava]